MKHAILVLLLCASAFAGDSCTTLYDHGDRDITLCSTEDPQSYTAYYEANGQLTRESITFERYTKMMEDDTKDIREHSAQVQIANETFSAKMRAMGEQSAANTRAMGIKSKKDCIAAGFVWTGGGCKWRAGRPAK